MFPFVSPERSTFKPSCHGACERDNKSLATPDWVRISINYLCRPNKSAVPVNSAVRVRHLAMINTELQCGRAQEVRIKHACLKDTIRAQNLDVKTGS